MNRGFVSDNCAGIHPDVLDALAACNAGHAPSYGADQWCDQATGKFAELFEKKVPVCFAFNGTGANILSLSSIVKPYHSILCAESAHINADETGAPERVLGAKLLDIPSPSGKLAPSDLKPFIAAQGNPHHSQPRVISITNVTEWGTVYTPEEVRALASFAHANGMLLHMDGARIANAVIACGCSMAEMTWKAGLDVLSFGGVKNGTMFGEAVLFFNESLAADALYLRKNITQLQSKMRYIGAQYIALLSNGLWSRNATHANAMALKLEAMLKGFDSIEWMQPVQANMLFVKMPEMMSSIVCAEGFGSKMGDVVRMVTAWDTREEEINALESLLR